MSSSPLAGKPAPRSLLANIPRLVTAYYEEHPDANDPVQRVAFGTSGHRGSAFAKTFNEAHILAISQAVSEYRAQAKIDGPLYIGIDTHALSEPAWASALEVLAANGVHVRYQAGRTYTPTPVVSHAIITFNRGRTTGPRRRHRRHAEPQPAGGRGVQVQPAPRRAPPRQRSRRGSRSAPTRFLAGGGKDVRRVPLASALGSGSIEAYDFVDPFVKDLANVVDDGPSRNPAS